MEPSLLPASPRILHPRCARLQSMLSPRNNRCSPEISIRKILIIFSSIAQKTGKPEEHTSRHLQVACTWLGAETKSQLCPRLCTLLEKPWFHLTHLWTQRNSSLLDGWAKVNLLHQHPRLGVILSFRPYKRCSENKAPSTAVSSGRSSKRLAVWLLSAWAYSWSKTLYKWQSRC